MNKLKREHCNATHPNKIKKIRATVSDDKITRKLKKHSSKNKLNLCCSDFTSKNKSKKRNSYLGEKQQNPQGKKRHDHDNLPNSPNKNSSIAHEFYVNNAAIVNLPDDSDFSSESDIVIPVITKKFKGAKIEECSFSITNFKNVEILEENIEKSDNTLVISNAQEPDFDNSEQYEENIISSNEDVISSQEDINSDSFEKKDLIRLNDFSFTSHKQAELFTIDNSCYLLLKHPYKIYFNGKIKVTPVIGKVKILGYTLSKCAAVFSPRGHSFLCIESIENYNIKDEIKALKSTGINLPVFEKHQEITNSISLVKLDYYDDNNSQFLELYTPQQLYPKYEIKSIFKNKPPLEQEILQCKFYSDNGHSFLFNESKNWNYIIQELENTVQEFQRIIVYGGKNVGKSTFLRYCTNKLLSKVDKMLYIDLDLGQSEFCIPGCISATLIETPILGPNFTQIRKQEKCIFIGEINVSLCVDRYLKAVEYLISYCKNIENFKTLPWVVNTMGFSRFLGVEIAVSTIKLIKPTHLIQIISKKLHINFYNTLTSEYVNSYSSDTVIHNSGNEPLKYINYLTQSVTDKHVGEWVIDAKQRRDMMILAYFSQMCKERKLITDVIPYRCSLENVKLVHINSEISDPSVFNAKLVALCEQNQIGNNMRDCLGFGIIRGIDLLSKDIYLLTPLEENELNKVNCLVLGNISLPSCVYLNTKSSKYIPFVSVINSSHTTKVPKRCSYNPKTIFKKLK